MWSVNVIGVIVIIATASISATLTTGYTVFDFGSLTLVAKPKA